MNEQEFREAYRALQERTTADEHLKMRTLAAAQSETHDSHAKNSTSDAQFTAQGTAQGIPAQFTTQDTTQGETHDTQTPTPRTRTNTLHYKRWILPAAACLIACVLAFGGIPLFSNLLGLPGGTSTTDTQKPLEFSVRAYAANGSPLAFGNDGTVVFDRVEPLQGISNNYSVEGYFTGCLIHVEGENIARVQMNTSKGKLYRYTTESFRKDDEPERMNELITSKPLNRGLGEYYGAYDEALILPFPADVEVKNDPDAMVQVGLSKIYGETIDVSAQDDPGIVGGETSFGLWTNEGDVEALSNEADPYSAIIDQFEGQKLTVTVTFEDGHTSTQVIELHAADFRCDEGDSNNPNDTTIIPEMIDPSTISEDEHLIHSLYGTVIEANRDAFPLSLEHANDMADTVLPADTLDKASETYVFQRRQDDNLTNVVLTESSLLDAQDTASVCYRPSALNSTNANTDEDNLTSDGNTNNTNNTSHEADSTLDIGPITITQAATPPNGKTPDAFTQVAFGWLGDLPYFNKCSQERYGYAFNDDGTLTSDGYYYLTATLTLHNPHDNYTDTLYTESLGRFGILDQTGQLLVIDTSYVLDAAVSGDAEVESDDPRTFTLAPKGNARVEVTFVLPQHLAESEDLLFMITADPLADPLVFAVGTA